MIYRAASGFVWFLLAPSNLFVFLAILGVAALFTRFWRAGRTLLITAIAAYVICGFGPVGTLLIRPLENRFPKPPEAMAAPYGIIVLGGGFIAEITNEREVTALAEEGGRLTETAMLALRFPDARVVYSGGSSDALGEDRNEAHVARRFFGRLGIPPERIVLEDRSLNTDENARFSRALLDPKPGQQWLLVTSARHVPRAVGAFRRAGFDVVPYPTDYQTTGKAEELWTLRTRPGRGITMVEDALHEWIGLVAYRLMGKSDSLFPGPTVFPGQVLSRSAAESRALRQF